MHGVLRSTHECMHHSRLQSRRRVTMRARSYRKHIVTVRCRCEPHYHRRRRRCDYRRRRYDTRDVRQSLCSRGRRSRVVCTSFLSRAITVHSVTVQGQQARVRCTPPRVDGYQPSTKPLRPHCILIRGTEHRAARCAGIHARKRKCGDRDCTLRQPSPVLATLLWPMIDCC